MKFLIGKLTLIIHLGGDMLKFLIFFKEALDVAYINNKCYFDYPFYGSYQAPLNLCQYDTPYARMFTKPVYQVTPFKGHGYFSFKLILHHWNDNQAGMHVRHVGYTRSRALLAIFAKEVCHKISRKACMSVSDTGVRGFWETITFQSKKSEKSK